MAVQFAVHRVSLLVGTLAVTAAGLWPLQCLAQPETLKSRALQERLASPELRDVRTRVVQPTDEPGRVVVDTRTIAAGATAGVPVTATDLAGNPVPLERVGASMVALRPSEKQWIVVRPTTTTTQSMQRGVQWLSGACLAPAADGSGAKDVFSSYADFSTVPVVWDITVDAYRVRGTVGVARNGDLAQGGAIGRTASVKMNFIGVSGAAPTEFEISDLGIEGEHAFSCLFAGTDVPAPTLLVRSSLGAEQPYRLDVRPRVVLTPRRNPILGLGMEEINVFVECVEAHGAPVRLDAPGAVLIQCSSGREEGADGLTLSADDPNASFRFRSSWLGPARIIATTRTPSGAIAGSLVVDQVMPWPQLAAALAGGALGGFARRFVRGARRRSTPRRTLEGLVVGLVAFVAGVLGVGFLEIPSALVATVAGAFLTGVLSGFAGVVVLERIQGGRAPAGGRAP